MRKAAFTLLLAAAGCAAPQPRGGGEAADLQAELAGRIEGRAESCVPSEPQTSLHIVDARTLTYRRGRTLWVNRLESDCPGLRPMDTLIVETHGGQHCRGDHVRSTPYGGGIPGPVCILGDFTPYRLPPR
ncbi:MAG: hypothetical protein JOZ90_11660 [Alphaproteobacteria bacterium]|nr:hypothetical protein [Alphaproteobacteria bacterium]MBV9372089.1 hypothetical protein [Alphaproteobacteria bacterium]MBV9901742.1 hypothetical protein [Alphaproteobacteria bacterium]